MFSHSDFAVFLYIWSIYATCTYISKTVFLGRSEKNRHAAKAVGARFPVATFRINLLIYGNRFERVSLSFLLILKLFFK